MKWLNTCSDLFHGLAKTENGEVCDDKVRRKKF